MSQQSELKSYKNELKENEKVIQTLTKKNKHIKDHIKYLEEQIKLQESNDDNNQTVSNEP